MARQIGKEAGLSRPYETFRTSGSTFEKEIKPLFEVLSSHSARRTFANRVYKLSGNDINYTCKLLGHSDVKTTMKYLGISADVKVDFDLI